MNELTEGDSCIVIPELIGVPVKFWSCKSCPSPTIKWVDDIAVCCNCGLTNKVKFNDPTPLSDLTDEQWREMRFDRKRGFFCNFWQWGSEGLTWLHWCQDHGLVINASAKAASNVKTLGQLRALIFAIGGEA